MSQAGMGNTVRVHYTGKTADGKVFDSSSGGDPIEFKIGERKVIPGFEEAIIGMEVGATRTAEIPPEKAYGQRQDHLIVQIDRDRVPADLNPQVGKQVELRGAEGEAKLAVVTEVSAKAVTVDANHPLAGHSLTFDLQLVEVR